MTTLHDIMREGFLFVVQRTAPVAHAVREMTDNNVGIVAILDGDRLVGVFSERDVVRRVVAKGLDPAIVRVGDVMTHELIVADENEDCHAAMRKMDQGNIRHLPVVRQGKLVSMLSVRDLMRVDMQRLGDEIKFLHEYLYTVPPELGAAGEHK
ncbi:MAG: CBS domain-containing protein [Deltaproteobacteria bacterium]|nr:CBS domain-containing protein [Deltaproteobacteria bacterium]MBI3388806.1 CBS domain-containing protein [Deltaproteobacteria bacterium]